MSRAAPQVQSDIVADLPEGFAWNHDPGSVTARSYAGLADAIARFEAAAEAQLLEATVNTADLMLDDYERVLGPDTCLGDPSAVPFTQRRAAAALRWTGVPGCSIADIISTAASLGVTATVTELRRNCAGVLRAGNPVRRHPEQFTWIVTLPPTTVVKFRAGASRASEPLGAIQRDTALECIIRRLAPAHTVPVFSYLQYLTDTAGQVITDTSGDPLLAPPEGVTVGTD
jgi:uncharacterized protein YmfQ (DUF2313 family)